MTPSVILWPIRSTDLARSSAGNSYNLVVERGVDVETVTFPAAVLTLLRYYWFAGDGQADTAGSVGGVGDLCQLLEDALNTHPSGGGFIVSLSPDNRITVLCSTTFRILWGDVGTTLNAIPFGFTQADPGSSDVGIVAPNQTRGAWCPLYSPSDDSRDDQTFSVGSAVALSGKQRDAVHAVAKPTLDLSYELMPRRYALDEYSDATEPTGALESAWSNALVRGFPVRFYRDASVRTSTSYGLYKSRNAELSGKRSEVIMRAPAPARFRWRAAMKLRRVA